jgi:polar amino acid transport system substrate-binding protein
VALRRTPERERFLSFSRPYGEEVRHQFLCAASSPLRLRALEDLRGLRVGLVRGFAYPPALSAALGPLDSWASWASSKAALLRMLAAGHVDVAVMNAVVADWLQNELQLERTLRVEPLVLRSGTATQMAFSRRPAALAALAAMNQGLAQLERSGWARFEARYLRTDRKP